MNVYVSTQHFLLLRHVMIDIRMLSQTLVSVPMDLHGNSYTDLRHVAIYNHAQILQILPLRATQSHRKKTPQN
jgi:hypothetical protein